MHSPPPALRRRNERGATASEYALLASLIAVFIIGTVTLFGTNLAGLYDRSCDDVATVAGATNC